MSKLTLSDWAMLSNLVVSIFFWIKLEDIYLAIYQSVPYVSSFIWLGGENVLKKINENNKSEDDL